MKHLRQTGGDDADDARVPALFREHQGPPIAQPPSASIIARASSTIWRSSSCRRELQVSSVAAMDIAFSRSSVVSISTAIIACSSRPAALIRGARPNATIPAVNRLFSSEPLTSIKAQTNARARDDARQAMPDDDSVLIGKRNHVGDGRKRHETQRSDQKVAQMRRRSLAVAKRFAHLPRELERNPRAAKIASGIGTSRQPRMNNRVRLRQLATDRMMIGDDQLNSQLAPRRASLIADMPQSTVTINEAWRSCASRLSAPH